MTSTANTRPCREDCQGWGVWNGTIQRCPVCNRFATDEDAVAHVMALEERERSPSSLHGPDLLAACEAVVRWFAGDHQSASSADLYRALKAVVAAAGGDAGGELPPPTSEPTSGADK